MIGMFKSPNHLVMIVLAVSVVQWILYFVSFGSIWKSLRGILGNVLKRFRERGRERDRGGGGRGRGEQK